MTLYHVKVEVDLTKQLPSVVEFEREDGEVVEVSVHYLGFHRLALTFKS